MDNDFLSTCYSYTSLAQYILQKFRFMENIFTFSGRKCISQIPIKRILIKQMPRKQILIETFFFPNRLSNLLMYLLHAKKVNKKIRLKWTKSLENHKAQFRKLSVFLLAKNRYYVIIAFKIMKMEFKFEHTRLTKKV